MSTYVVHTSCCQLQDYNHVHMCRHIFQLYCYTCENTCFYSCQHTHQYLQKKTNTEYIERNKQRHRNTRTHVYRHTNTFYTHTYILSRTHARAHAHAHTHTHAHAHTRARAQTHTHTRTLAVTLIFTQRITVFTSTIITTRRIPTILMAIVRIVTLIYICNTKYKSLLLTVAQISDTGYG